MLIRAIGPTLTRNGIDPLLVLADPFLELHGPAGLITSNNNWRDTQEIAIQATGIPPTNDLESAILVTLAPGNVYGDRARQWPVGTPSSTPTPASSPTPAPAAAPHPRPDGNLQPPGGPHGVEWEFRWIHRLGDQPGAQPQRPNDQAAVPPGNRPGRGRWGVAR